MPKAVHIISRYSALLAILGVWVIFIVGMRQTHLALSDSRPLSYLGISSFAPYFKAGLLGGLVLMAVFYDYLKRVFAPTQAFRNIYFIGLAMQAIVTFTPYQLNGRAQWLHWTAALILAGALVFAPWIFAGSKTASDSTKRISKSVTLLYFAILIVETVLLVAFKYYVISELFNLLIFHAWIIYLTFDSNLNP